MTGRNQIATEFFYLLGKSTEFYRLIAIYAGVRSFATDIAVGKVLHNGTTEFIAKVDRNMREAESCRNCCRIGFIPFGRTLESAHCNTEQIISALLKKQSCNGAVNSAAHSNTRFHHLRSNIGEIILSVEPSIA